MCNENPNSLTSSTRCYLGLHVIITVKKAPSLPRPAWEPCTWTQQRCDPTWPNQTYSLSKPFCRGPLRCVRSNWWMSQTPNQSPSSHHDVPSLLWPTHNRILNIRGSGLFPWRYCSRFLVLFNQPVSQPVTRVWMKERKVQFCVKINSSFPPSTSQSIKQPASQTTSYKGLDERKVLFCVKINSSFAPSTSQSINQLYVSDQRREESNVL